ncbi:hypothetical protein CM15mP43_07100 [bacterium]|nr:MAG: hypothetical protein CM15mP43_07100 [bacterium]
MKLSLIKNIKKKLLIFLKIEGSNSWGEKKIRLFFPDKYKDHSEKLGKGDKYIRFLGF